MIPNGSAWPARGGTPPRHASRPERERIARACVPGDHGAPGADRTRPPVPSRRREHSIAAGAGGPGILALKLHAYRGRADTMVPRSEGCGRIQTTDERGQSHSKERRPARFVAG
jgi:hypothetical protein